MKSVSRRYIFGLFRISETNSIAKQSAYASRLVRATRFNFAAELKTTPELHIARNTKSFELRRYQLMGFAFLSSLAQKVPFCFL
jgi:hypothetical protein